MDAIWTCIVGSPTLMNIDLINRAFEKSTFQNRQSSSTLYGESRNPQVSACNTVRMDEAEKRKQSVDTALKV